MLRDLWPGQLMVALGRRSEQLAPDGSARLLDAVVLEARRRGLERVRVAAPLAPVAAPPSTGIAWGNEGNDQASWGDDVEAAALTVWPTPPPGATWLEISRPVLDQAALAEGPGGAALTLEVTSVRTSTPAAGGEPRAAEVRFTLVDPAPLPEFAAPLGEGDAETLRAATARLIERAAGRLASLLVPAAAVAAPAPGPPAHPETNPVPAEESAVPLEATYVARTWVIPQASSQRGGAAADGAFKGAEAGGHLALLGLFCGPLAPACMFALGLAGAGAGLVVGAVGGAASAPATPPSGPMEAALPPEPERTALLGLLRRQAEGLSLAAAVERSALLSLRAGADEAGAPPRLARLEVRLTGDEGSDHPARLALILSTAPPPGLGGPDLLVLETPDALPARTWADDGGALLGLVLQRAAGAAGEALVTRARQAAAQAAAPEVEPAPPAPAPAATADPEPDGATWADER